MRPEKKWKTIAFACFGWSLFTTAAFAYFFYYGRGHSVDQRRYIVVTKEERHLILHEMRNLLAGVRGIIKGVSERDFKVVAYHARKNGMVMASEARDHAALVTKLPLEFKKLGFGTHRSFDHLADRAEQMSGEEILKETATIMNNCVACHAAHRITD